MRYEFQSKEASRLLKNLLQMAYSTFILRANADETVFLPTMNADDNKSDSGCWILDFE